MSAEAESQLLYTPQVLTYIHITSTVGNPSNLDTIGPRRGVLLLRFPDFNVFGVPKGVLFKAVLIQGVPLYIFCSMHVYLMMLPDDVCMAILSYIATTVLIGWFIDRWFGLVTIMVLNRSVGWV